MLLPIWLTVVIAIQIVEYFKYRSLKRAHKEQMIKHNKLLASWRGLDKDLSELQTSLDKANVFLKNVQERLNKAGL